MSMSPTLPWTFSLKFGPSVLEVRTKGNFPALVSLRIAQVTLSGRLESARNV